jgi:gluconokinase
MAADVAPGAEGLICLPFFAGERSPNWNMNTRGVFFGLTLKHNARHIARALLEGVAFRLRTLKETLNEMGCEINEVRASGGLTRSDLWPQIIASALKVELGLPQWGETSSLGAALWALLGTGVIHKLEEIGKLVPSTRTYRPVKKDSERYDQLFDIYKELYLAMDKSFDRIADISEQK